MVKAYLRYEHVQQFGVVAVPNCNTCSSTDGSKLYTGALENINGWRVKTCELDVCLEQRVQESEQRTPEVTQIAHSPATSILAAGYANGCIRTWDTTDGACLAVLQSHTGSVSALAYNSSGGLVASGSQDTDIIVWDVAGEVGLYKLKAHTNQVTAVAFLDKQNKLLSSGKDGFVRVWDLSVQFCIQVVPIHAGAVWSMAVNGEQTRAVVGSVANEVQVFRIDSADLAQNNGGGIKPASMANTVADDQPQVLVLQGTLDHDTTHRIARIAFSTDGIFLAACSTGNKVQVWRQRSAKEAQKKLKRRQKRAEAKVQGADSKEIALQPADEWEAFTVHRATGPVRSLAFIPGTASKATVCRLGLTLADNSVTMLSVTADGEAKAVNEISLPGNRSDVRALALSDDDSRIISCGNGGSKVWDVSSGECLNSLPGSYGLSVMFAPGGKFAVVGCKSGKLDLISLGASEVVRQIDAHDKQVWCLDSLPDKTGFVSCSADGHVKVWKWAAGDQGNVKLTATEALSINTGQDVLCVRLSPDSKLLAASLISNVIKVFYLDSLKWFVDLYGHKLPALTMDISSDSTLLVSGSADKNIKIWGLDFGDCHKSLFAHQDSVMAVAFVRNTHYIFTAGKDKMVKYWDADTFELLLELPAHHGSVWALQVSSLGDFLVTGSHDRSIRRWEKTDETFFLEEEKEKRLERVLDADAGKAEQSSIATAAGDGSAVVTSSVQTQEAAHGVDRLIDALDMMETEEERKGEAGYQPNVMLLGVTGSEYVLKAVRTIRANDLEAVLTMLSFPDALAILKLIPRWLDGPLNAELCVRVSVFILKAHQAKLVASPGCKSVLADVQTCLREQLGYMKNLVGFNMAGLRHLQGLHQNTK